MKYLHIILNIWIYALLALAVLGIGGLVFHLFTGGLAGADYGIYR